MSLTAAMSTALSGLTANVRAAGIVSNNIANADTEGYARRILDLSIANAGTAGGVTINGVIRQTNAYIIEDRRAVQSELAYSNEIQGFYETMESAVGGAEDSGSLTYLLTQFENAINTAAANPAQDQRLESLAYAAEDLVEKINLVSDEIQSTRELAEDGIESMIETINDNLEAVAEINKQIIKVAARDGDISSLEDQRQVLLDDLSDYIPLTTKLQDNGVMHVYTKGGLTLLERNVSTFSFEKSNIIDASLSYENGDFSALMLNDIELNTTSTGSISGGSLAALFEIRDEYAVTEQEQIDAIARDLIERFADSGLDATIGTANIGLFTDSGSALVAANETGIASRLTLNSAVQPDGGEFWKLRDGLYATAQGDVGDASLLNAYSEKLSEQTVPSSANLDAVQAGFISHIEEFSSGVSSSLYRAQNDTTFTNTRYLATKEAELELSVDTDQELQILIRVEQQYAANAQVMSVIDELMERLLNTF